MRLDEGFDAGEGFIKGLAGLDGFGEDADRAHPQAARVIFVGGDHLYGDVAGGCIFLEAMKDSPAVDVGQIHVERDGDGLSFAGDRDCRGAARSYDRFETVLVSKIHKRK